MRNVMIDLESLGTTPHSVVLSIAVMEFELKHEGPIFGDFFEFIGDMEEQYVEHARMIDEATIEWWTSPEQAEAKKAWYKKSPTPISVLEEKLKKMIRTNTRVWAHGSDFDFPMLYSFLRDYGVAPMWIYNAVRDSRTIERELPIIRTRPNGLNFIKHDAKDDCATQVWSLWERMPESSEIFG